MRTCADLQSIFVNLNLYLDNNTKYKLFFKYFLEEKSMYTEWGGEAIGAVWFKTYQDNMVAMKQTMEIQWA